MITGAALSLSSGVDLALMAGGLLLVGCFVGFMAGLLGIGAGAAMILVLYEFFTFLDVPIDVRMHLSVGTSLAVMVPTSLRSFAKHRVAGAVDMEIWRIVGSGVVVGAVIGVLIASAVKSDVLKIVFIVFATILAANLALGLGRIRLHGELPGPVFLRPFGAVVGVVSTLMGIGGGVFVAGLMALYGRTIHQAIATSSGFGPLIAIPASIGYVWAGWDTAVGVPGALGFVHLPGAALIAITSVQVAPLGVRVAHGLPRRTLELIFAGFLAVVSTRLAFSLLG